MTATSKKKSTEASASKGPALIAFHFVPESKGRKPVYIPIGAAIEHPDGEGYTLRLDLFPTGNGQILLRKPTRNGEANGNLPMGSDS
jgi:hypothetical protein